MAGFVWLEGTSVARTVAGSLGLTAGLSAAHLLGFTLATGGALLVNLRLLGAVLRRVALTDVLRPAGRVIAIGVAVSVMTGFLLFSGRASTIAANGLFQAKISLLILAVVWQSVTHYRLATGTGASPRMVHTSGVIGLLLWLGLSLTACAFILLE